MEFLMPVFCCAACCTPRRQMILDQPEPYLQWIPLVPKKSATGTAMYAQRGRLDPLEEEQQLAGQIERNCLFLFPEVKGIIIVTNTVHTVSGVEQTAYVLAVPLKDEPQPPQFSLQQLPGMGYYVPPPLTLFYPPPLGIVTPPPSTPSLQGHHSAYEPRYDLYQPVPTLPAPSLFQPDLSAPELRYSHEDPDYVHLPPETVPYKVLLKGTTTANTGDAKWSLTAALIKTDAMMKEHITGFVRYADSFEGVVISSELCSCPQAFHPEPPAFTEKDRAELNQNRRKYLVSKNSRRPYELGNGRVELERLKEHWEARQMAWGGFWVG